MAKNTDAQEARRAQDVVAYVPFPSLSINTPPPNFPSTNSLNDANELH